jgi:hypothetical protein
MRRDANREIGRVLTRRQKAAFNQMLGDPFDVMRLGPDSTLVESDQPTAEAPTEFEPVPPAANSQPTSTPAPNRAETSRTGSRSSRGGGP